MNATLKTIPGLSNHEAVNRVLNYHLDWITSRDQVLQARKNEDAARDSNKAAQVEYAIAHNTSIQAVMKAATLDDWEQVAIKTQAARNAWSAMRKNTQTLEQLSRETDSAQALAQVIKGYLREAIEEVERRIDQVAEPTVELEPAPSLDEQLVDSLKGKGFIEVPSIVTSPEPTPGQLVELHNFITGNVGYTSRTLANQPAPEPDPQGEPDHVAGAAGGYVNKPSRPVAPPVDRDQAIGDQVRAELAAVPAKAPILPEPNKLAVRSRAVAMLKVLLKADAPVAVAAIMRETGMSAMDVSRAGYDLRHAGKAQKIGPGFWAHKHYTGPKFDDNRDQHWAKKAATAEV